MGNRINQSLMVVNETKEKSIPENPVKATENPVTEPSITETPSIIAEHVSTDSLIKAKTVNDFAEEITKDIQASLSKDVEMSLNSVPTESPTEENIPAMETAPVETVENNPAPVEAETIPTPKKRGRPKKIMVDTDSNTIETTTTPVESKPKRKYVRKAQVENLTSEPHETKRVVDKNKYRIMALNATTNEMYFFNTVREVADFLNRGYSQIYMCLSENEKYNKVKSVCGFELTYITQKTYAKIAERKMDEFNLINRRVAHDRMVKNGMLETQSKAGVPKKHSPKNSKTAKVLESLTMGNVTPKSHRGRPKKSESKLEITASL
jgi:hypothetical protein